jgi:nucleotide-binding universal stress UspA family protein
MKLEPENASTADVGIVFKHMLLPVDFSDSNMAAACYAQQIAKWGDPQVTLLHVTPPLPAIDIVHRETIDIPAELDRILHGLHVREVVIEGDPADAISEYARQNSVDLIVMPTRGVGAIRRFLLGSVTAKVLHDADCPVLTFVSDRTPTLRSEPYFRRIACAIDLGPDSLRTIRWAGAIAERCAASLTILYASPQLEPVVGVVHDTEWCNHLSSVLRAEIEKLRTEATVDAVVRLAGGEPARTVAEMTSEVEADLLVIGRPRPRGLLGRLRTHSYGIISQSPCPVLSV